MSKRDIDLALVPGKAFFTLSVDGGVRSDDSVLQRIIALLLLHSDPDNTYTLDGFHPQELIARITSGSVDSCIERLNIIGTSISKDINDDLQQDDADGIEAVSSILFSVKEGSTGTSPTILVEIRRMRGDRITAELVVNE